MRIQKDGPTCEECKDAPSVVRFGGYHGGVTFHVCAPCLRAALQRWGGEAEEPHAATRRILCDRLAATLADVREACGDLVGARLVMHVRDGGCVDHAERSETCEACAGKPRSARGEIEDRFLATLAAAPADLAAAHDARVRSAALRWAAEEDARRKR